MLSLLMWTDVPKDQRLQAVQAAIMLMSDENREVLQTLLCFLSDVTSSVEENQMTPMNIAVCLAPSLFHLNILKKDNLSPRCVVMSWVTVNWKRHATSPRLHEDIVGLLCPSSHGCSRLLSLWTRFRRTFKTQCFMSSCCVLTKLSSVIYQVEIIAKGIKGGFL